MGTGPSELEELRRQNAELKAELGRLQSERRSPENERLLRQVFEHIGDYTLLLEPAPGGAPLIRDLNEAALRAHGYSREELIGKPVTVLDAETGPSRSLGRQRGVLERGSDRFGVVHRRKDGTLFEAEVVASRIRLGAEELILSVERDVTERNRMEQALRESTELFRQFMLHSPIYTFVKEVQPHRSTVLFASENYEQMVGIKGSAMAGKAMEELFPAEFAVKMTADDWAVVSRGEVLNLDEELNGRSYVTIKFPIALGARRLLAGYTIDITERKRTEEALRESEARLVRAQAQAHVGNWELDLATRRMWASPEAFHIYGLERTSPFLPLDRIQRIPLPEERPRLDAALAGLVQQRVPYDLEFRIERADDGSLRIIHSVAQLDCDAAGTPRRVVGALQDITERKRLEEEREKLQAQLQQAHKMESVGRLAGGVAHDFNNMLSVILGHTELTLEELEPGSPHRADLEEVRHAAQRSADLTRQLLAFARKQTAEPRVLDLNATVEGTLKMLRRLIGEQVSLSFEPQPGLPAVKVDPSQIDQILANLCLNARDAIAGVGRVTLQTRTVALGAGDAGEDGELAPGEYVILSVTDTGCGIDRGVLEHLFEPFFTTKEQGKGTGLGLATVYGIVKQNGGFINVFSEPGLGSTFNIYLPCHREKPADSAAGGQAAPRQGLERVLLVEDEPSLLSMGRRMLEALGYSVVAAPSPAEALLRAREMEQVDLLLTDVVMPEMNGRQLAEKVVELHPKARLLFTSGYTADVIAVQGVLGSGVHFLPKPFTRAALAAKVREALE
ncbi:MAG: PAS domain S-box protein [Myxococcales bacterium]